MVVPILLIRSNKFGVLLKSSVTDIDEAGKHFEKALNLKHKYTFAREKYLKRLRAATQVCRGGAAFVKVDVEPYNVEISELSPRQYA